MKTRILRYLKHIGLTILTLAIAAISFGLYHGASLHYADHPKLRDLDNEGPYLFYENDSVLSINYIQGNKNEGFYVNKQEYPVGDDIAVKSYFALDDSSFEFAVQSEFKIPPVTYNDGEDILAISDIEGGYKVFRDFLIHSQVIDADLNWVFGQGHLVLVGDFVDRGSSTTQVLWFIYKLEQDAKEHGGHVHFILGNHEIKNLQGNHGAAADRYIAVSRILEKQQFQLYDDHSVIGRWLASKNTVERINEILFAHGGIHPNLADSELTLQDLNATVRKHYSTGYYPKPDGGIEQFLISTKTGPSWYRGYFKDDLSEEDVEKGLKAFNAKAVVVGHTIQSKVTSHFNGKVFGIDVKHPKDYHKNWPKGTSEGLFIENGTYYRVLDNGEKKTL